MILIPFEVSASNSTLFLKNTFTSIHKKISGWNFVTRLETTRSNNKLGSPWCNCSLNHSVVFCCSVDITFGASDRWMMESAWFFTKSTLEVAAKVKRWSWLDLGTSCTVPVLSGALGRPFSVCVVAWGHRLNINLLFSYSPTQHTLLSHFQDKLICLVTMSNKSLMFSARIENNFIWLS